MRTIREAISKGARSIYCNDGTLIVHLDYNQSWDAVCPPKTIDGKKIYRYIFCRITRVGGIIHQKELDQMDLYKDVLHYDFILREKDMNCFINNMCGGIDEYRTMYWVNQYDY